MTLAVASAVVELLDTGLVTIVTSQNGNTDYVEAVFRILINFTLQVSTVQMAFMLLDGPFDFK
jgi:hypothetical protein